MINHVENRLRYHAMVKNRKSGPVTLTFDIQ